jgi:dienelactone hydrolase
MTGSEEIVRFGAEESLLGIVTRTRPGSPEVERPGVILLNAGVIHRVGPHRMSVILARRLAASGFSALRFDLGGLGDSRAARSEHSFQERAVADARSAMDFLERAGLARRFVFFGLCSGADHGLATALVDPRVAAVVMIDPFTYVTPRARARKLAKKIESLGSVRRVAEWGLGLGARKLREKLQSSARAETEETQSGRVPPPAETFGGWLRTLADREVPVLALYSGALGERYNHEDQLFETFPDLRGRIDREWFPEANHSFTPQAAQQRMVDVVTRWLDRRFPSAPSR